MPSPPLFVLDQNFPMSIVSLIRLPDLVFRPLREIYPDLIEGHEDWEVMRELKVRGGADGWITLDRNMLSPEKEVAANMTTEHERPSITGARAYQQWRARLLADPENRRVYDEEAAKMDLWLQLVEARQVAGLTQAQLAERLRVSQAQVARMEKRGYDAYTLTSLRRYVQALGEGFELEVRVRTPRASAPVSAAHG